MFPKSISGGIYGTAEGAKRYTITICQWHNCSGTSLSASLSHHRMTEINYYITDGLSLSLLRCTNTFGRSILAQTGDAREMRAIGNKIIPFASCCIVLLISDYWSVLQSSCIIYLPLLLGYFLEMRCSGA